jgi:hypothetical protein
MKTTKYKERGIKQKMLFLTRQAALPLVHRMNNLCKVIILQTAFVPYFKNTTEEAGRGGAFRRGTALQGGRSRV